MTGTPKEILSDSFKDSLHVEHTKRIDHALQMPQSFKYTIDDEILTFFYADDNI